MRDLGSWERDRSVSECWKLTDPTGMPLAIIWQLARDSIAFQWAIYDLPNGAPVGAKWSHPHSQGVMVCPGDGDTFAMQECEEKLVCAGICRDRQIA